tara:strand:- start:95 stop:277 length:183 start_codon:yes stop_codon:yes gene_type:complete
MTKQITLNISFPEDEIDLYNEHIRVSNLTYDTASRLGRRFIREGLQNLSTRDKLICGSIV